MTVYQFTIVIEPDEDQFHAFAPALPGCHSFGSTIEEARDNLAEAIELHIEGMIEDGEPVPVEREPIFVTQRVVPVAQLATEGYRFYAAESNDFADATHRMIAESWSEV